MCNQMALQSVLTIMQPRFGHAARRELAFVLSLAVSGVALVLLVAFAPWYDPVVLGLAR
jgi:hypothetical protein